MIQVYFLEQWTKTKFPSKTTVLYMMYKKNFYYEQSKKEMSWIIRCVHLIASSHIKKWSIAHKSTSLYKVVHVSQEDLEIKC